MGGANLFFGWPAQRSQFTFMLRPLFPEAPRNATEEE